MAVVAGIDEAGLGPVLGPLVVSASAFEMPDEMVGLSMWEALSSAVRKTPSRRRGGVVIGDSKRLFSRQRENPLEHLERGVLASLAAMNVRPESLRAMMNSVAKESLRHLPAYPWYASADLALPRCISATDAMLSGNALSAAMAAAGMRILGLRAEVVLPGEFNRLIDATDNKSVVLFDVTSRLLARLWRRGAGGRLHVFVDHQGGRVRYLPALQRLFEGCRFKVLQEEELLSSYSIIGDDTTAEVHFTARAEDEHLPVALASMLSKYLRELMMELFNRFWTDQSPGLAPTAGYYEDGRRFYGCIRPLILKSGLDERLIYRFR